MTNPAEHVMIANTSRLLVAWGYMTAKELRSSQSQKTKEGMLKKKKSETLKIYKTAW